MQVSAIPRALDSALTHSINPVPVCATRAKAVCPSPGQWTAERRGQERPLELFPRAGDVAIFALLANLNARQRLLGQELSGRGAKTALDLVALVPAPHLCWLETKVLGTMRISASLCWLAAICAALATGELVCIDERPAAQLSTNLTAVVGCSRDLLQMQAAMDASTISAVRSVMGVMGPNTTLVVPLPENTTALDPLPLFCAAFTFDPDTEASECV